MHNFSVENELLKCKLELINIKNDEHNKIHDNKT